MIPGTSRAFPKWELYEMLETAASVGWKVQDAIEWLHGNGRLVALSATVADLAKTIDFDDVVGYSITLSARTNNAGGTVTPIALAVLRLITCSN